MQKETQVDFKFQGMRLFGMLHRPFSKPSPTLLICHGFSGHRGESHRLFVKTSRRLAQLGIASLRFDFLGHGESEGDFRHITITRQIKEATAALAFLHRQKGVDTKRLGILGHSMGGAVAATLAGRDLGFKALVLWNAVAHPLKNFSRSLGGPKKLNPWKKRGWTDLAGNVLNRGFLDDLPKHEPLRRLPNFKGQALILRGTADRIVLAWQAKAYRAALKGRSRLEMVPGGDHAFCSVSSEGMAIEFSVEFLKKALIGLKALKLLRIFHGLRTPPRQGTTRPPGRAKAPHAGGARTQAGWKDYGHKTDPGRMAGPQNL